jgi:hypothetical protein
MERRLSIVIAVLWLVGCGTVEGPAQTSKFEGEGWQTFSSARTGDGPGRIYRIDRDGQVFQVTQVNVTAKTDDQRLYKVERKTELTLKEVLKTIGVAEAKLPGSVTAQLERKANFQTESVNGRREFLEDRDLPENTLRDALTGIRIRDENTYFLIRETLASNKLTFTVSRNWITQLGVEAEIKKLVESTSGVEWKDGTEVSLDTTFDKPYRIWFKAEQLNIERNTLGAGPGQPLKVSRLPGSFNVRIPERVNHVP